MKLHENLWWPKTWNTTVTNSANGQDVPRDQVRQDGSLDTCEITDLGLIIGVDYRGKEVFGRVPSPSLNSPGNLPGLRDFLLDYTDDSMSTVEDLDVTPDQFKTRAKAEAGAAVTTSRQNRRGIIWKR